MKQTCIAAIIVSGVAAALYYTNGFTIYASHVLIFCLFICLFLVYSQITGRTKNPTTVFMGMLVLAGLHLLNSSSEITNTSIWMLLLPPLITFNLGLKRGIILLVLMFIGASVILLLPGLPSYTSYSSTYKLRFLSVLFCSMFFSGSSEYARYKTQQRLQVLTEKLQQQASSDPLTNLANRRKMYELMNREKARSKRHGLVYSIVIADIDNFKQVNDIYGHSAGDAAITHAANIFTRHLRQEDYIARWGGEEFLIMLANTGAQEAYAVTERIRTTLMNSSFTTGDQRISITASFGICTSSSDSGEDTSLEQEIHEADMYMYAAKKTGKNKTIQYLTFGSPETSTLNVVTSQKRQVRAEKGSQDSAQV